MNGRGEGWRRSQNAMRNQLEIKKSRVVKGTKRKEGTDKLGDGGGGRLGKVKAYEFKILNLTKKIERD